MIKNLLMVAYKGKSNILWKFIANWKERINFAKNHSLCMN